MMSRNEYSLLGLSGTEYTIRGYLCAVHGVIGGDIGVEVSMVIGMCRD